MTANAHDLILYDGVCGLCNRFVQFIIARDSRDQFRFAALQTELGRSLVAKHGGDPSALSTVYLIQGWDTDSEVARTRGKAALHVISRLGGGWRVLGLLRVLPGPLLNIGYGIVAKLRYRLFGKLDACPVPTPATRSKFLDVKQG